MVYTVRIAIHIIICFFLIHSPVLAAGPAVGSVTRIKATALLDGKEAVVGSHVFSGSVISTDANGRLEVTFNDQTKLQVGGDSTFVIDDFAYDDGKDHSVQKAVFHLVKGSFRMITSKLIDANPENFGVRTPLASIGIRGTDFWGGYLTDIEFDIVMLEGKGVIVSSMGGVVEISEPGVGVSVADPIKHPKGYEKALLPPKRTLWSAEKLARATATVSFD